MDSKGTDSLIFDMDGTLWNACSTYAAEWNAAFEKFGKDRRVTGDDLQPLMGKTADEIFHHLCAGLDLDFATFMPAVNAADEELMPKLGGKLFPHVHQGLEKLSKRYRLFMVSNCGKNGLKNFTEFTHTTAFFTETVAWGQRPAPKSENMKYLQSKYSLKAPIYFGDTQGDCDQTHLAGLPFAFAAYGFGTCRNPEISFASFDEFVEFFMNL